MNRQAIVLVVLVFAFVVFLFRFRTAGNAPKISQEPSSTALFSESNQKQLEEVLGRKISEDAEKLELEDLTGSGLTAIASRKESQGIVEFTILADLEGKGKDYEVFVGRNESNIRRLGSLTMVKGGFLFDYRESGIIEDFDYVLVRDGNDKILEGSFR